MLEVQIEKKLSHFLVDVNLTVEEEILVLIRPSIRENDHSQCDCWFRRSRCWTNYLEQGKPSFVEIKNHCLRSDGMSGIVSRLCAFSSYDCGEKHYVRCQENGCRSAY